MARDSDSLLITKWAVSGDTETPESAGLDRDEGWPVAYSQPGGNNPEREVFNELYKEHSAMLVELNKGGGFLEWDSTTIDYEIGASVKGSDDNLYFATAVSGPATATKDPTTGANRPGFWQSFEEKAASGGFPVGGVVAFPTLAAIPASFLICNGAGFSGITYPLLETALGGTTLPETRGEFIRGADQGRGVDSGRVIGSSQTDLVRGHKHETSVVGTSKIVKTWTHGTGTSMSTANEGGAGSSSGAVRLTGPVTSLDSTETRPVNIAFVYAIKAE